MSHTADKNRLFRVKNIHCPLTNPKYDDIYIKSLPSFIFFPSNKDVICPVRLAVRTPDSHSGDRGSIPLRGAMWRRFRACEGVFERFPSVSNVFKG